MAWQCFPPPSLPPPQQQLLVAHPHRPSTSPTRQISERGSQHGLTDTNSGMKEENKVWHCLAFTPITTHRLQPPHRPSTPLTRQTRERGSQHGLTNTTLGEGGEGWPGNASSTAPTSTATCSTPPPTVDVSDTTNTRTRQPAWPHRYNPGRGR
jgi:hypothetical protein